MYIDINKKQAALLLLALATYKAEAQHYIEDSGRLGLLDGIGTAEKSRDEAEDLIQTITEVQGRDWPDFRLETKDRATEAFWFVKEKIDVLGQVHRFKGRFGPLLEWNEGHRYPYVGISTDGKLVLYGDEYKMHVCSDTEILEVAMKIQEDIA